MENLVKSKVPVYDIESISWTDPIGVGFYDGNNYHEFLKLKEEDDVILDFLNFLETGTTKDGQVIVRGGYKGIKIYAHNAAKYDAKFILAKLQQLKNPVRLDSGLYRLVWLKPRITFEDSYAALPGSLRELAEGFGVSMKLEWEHEDTKYPWHMPVDELRDFRLYMKRDCICLSEIMEEYCKLLLHFYGVTPSLTLALTAVKAFDKKFYPVSKIDSNEDYEVQIRKATYGGRNEVYKMYGENLNFYDVRSMYVSCYDTPVPIGKLLWSTPNIDNGSFAYAKVKVPKDTYVGPLPVRHNGGLIFPVGELPPSWWDTIELRQAVSQGCDLKIEKQLEGDEEPILKEFADYTYNLRLLAGKEVENRLWKLFGLRLSGKFGQSRYQTQVVHSSNITDFTGTTPIDDNEEYHEVMQYVKGSRSPYIKPAINARIRAEARVRHTKLLLKAMSIGNIYYCDTDSIITDAEMPTGPRMGDLGLVRRAVRGYFLQGKLYGYVTSLGIGQTAAGFPKHKEGSFNQQSAGFRDFKLSEWDFRRLLSGETEIEEVYMGLSNWREVLKTAEVRQLPRTRKVSSQLGFKNRKKVGADTEPLEFVKKRGEYKLI